MAGSWLVRWRPEGPDRPTLVCLAQAGAGCGQYRPWQKSFGDQVTVLGVQLPCRENRFTDPAAETVPEVVDAAAEELAAALPDSQPYVVFGNSFGGLLGYEIARRLGHTYGRWPLALVVAACKPPAMWAGAGRGLVEQEDELNALLEARGLDPEYFDEESRQLALDVLRHDANLSVSYRHEGDPLVPCRLEAWSGEDDPIVDAHFLDDWKTYAGGEFVRRTFPGGHYFCLERGDLLLPALRELFTAHQSPERIGT